MSIKNYLLDTLLCTHEKHTENVTWSHDFHTENVTWSHDFQVEIMTSNHIFNAIFACVNLALWNLDLIHQQSTFNLKSNHYIPKKKTISFK